MLLDWVGSCRGFGPKILHFESVCLLFSFLFRKIIIYSWATGSMYIWSRVIRCSLTLV